MRILEVVGLTKRFGGRIALDAVSFTAEEGQILALFGPRGAGKTTCAHCLSGVISPTPGASSSMAASSPAAIGMTLPAPASRGPSRSPRSSRASPPPTMSR